MHWFWRKDESRRRVLMSSERDAAFLSSGMHPLLCFGSTWFVRGRDKRVFLFDFVFFFCLVSGSDIPPFSLLFRFVLAERSEELKELFRVAFYSWFFAAVMELSFVYEWIISAAVARGIDSRIFSLLGTDGLHITERETNGRRKKHTQAFQAAAVMAGKSPTTSQLLRSRRCINGKETLAWAIVVHKHMT